ncbi:MAG TPA: CAP domain-containing protein [Planctomycetaceae bacterium]|nr:CAP domain-containing protein [Planctomycetaceae bacterium]
MRKRFTLLLLTMSITGLGSAGLAGSKEERPDPDRYGWLVRHPVIQRLLKFHNEERARYGLPPLQLAPEMCLAAQEHATWMAETGYYMHSNLPWAEIIFAGPLSAREAVDGWIASPAHHSIMLSGTEAGFGYMVRDGQTYWVGVFR